MINQIPPGELIYRKDGSKYGPGAAAVFQAAVEPLGGTALVVVQVFCQSIAPRSPTRSTPRLISWGRP
jgi:hypothetical protein